MGWAYSVDLRERVVAAFDRAGMTDPEAAALFKIGEATVRRWKRLKAPRLRAGRYRCGEDGRRTHSEVTISARQPALTA